MTTDALMDRLDAIDAKLERIDRRQRVVESLIDEMTPVVQEAMRATSVQLADLESRGYFAVGRELVGMVDKVVTRYGADEVAELSEHIFEIVDTVRNVTQPDVLEKVNDATDAIHEADTLDPVGPVAALRATRDEEVQRGLAIALEVLRHLGQHHPEASPRPARRPSAARTAPTPARAAKPAAAPAPAKPASPAQQASAEPVLWNGHQFTPEGFLVEPSEWTESLGGDIAAALDQPLTEDHWTVIRWARSEYLEAGASPNVRRVASGSGAGTKRVYQLFPKSPGKTIARIAGIPKPVGCI